MKTFILFLFFAFQLYGFDTNGVYFISKPENSTKPIKFCNVQTSKGSIQLTFLDSKMLSIDYAGKRLEYKVKANKIFIRRDDILQKNITNLENNSFVLEIKDKISENEYTATTYVNSEGNKYSVYDVIISRTKVDQQNILPYY